MNNIKVSIITICRNAEKTIADTLESVRNQSYPNIEHVIVDGLSSDSTNNIIRQYLNDQTVYVSEQDHGLYDALNKGFKMASGHIIGILHSDDVLAGKDSIAELVSLFEKHPDADAISASVNIYKNNQFSKPYRRYKATRFRIWQFRLGMQPPHPGFYIRKETFEKIGYFNAAFRISGDFDWLLRALYIDNIKVVYTDLLLVKMRDGGISSSGYESKKRMNRENLKSLKSHGIYSNKVMIYSKYLLKVFQLARL